MLQQIRDRARGWVIWVLLALIIVTIGLWGIENYFTPTSKTKAASVNGIDISWQAVEKVTERLSQEREPTAGEENRERALKEEARSALIQRAALLDAVQKQGFRATEEQIARVLTQIPEFQVDGKFSKEQYQKVLRSFSYTDSGFQQLLMEDILLDQLPRGLVFSSFVLPSELNRAIQLLDQTREFGYFKIPFQKYRSEVQIKPTDIEDYYKAHKNEFSTKEQVKLEYVTLSIKKLVSDITISDAEVKEFYEKHPDLYTTPDLVQASHILIALPKESDSDKEKAAQAKAEDLLKKAKQGENFADLAKQFSQDPVSAKKGGDLGWFGHGEMVPAFEEAAFSLKNKGEMTLVRSDFGYHIIKLLDKRPSRVQPLIEVKQQVFENIRREKAENLFSEKSEFLATLAFENGNTLKPIFEQMGLTIQETEFFDRAGGKGIARIPAVINNAFSEEVLIRKKNSDLIQLDADSYAIVRVKEHKPSKERPLTEVEASIREYLLKMATFEKARTVGEKIAKQMEEGKNVSQLASTYQLQWIPVKNTTRMSKNISPNLLEVVFSLPRPAEKAKQIVAHFPLDDSHYAVLSLLKVVNGKVPDPNSEKAKTSRFNLAQLFGRIEYALYTTRVMQEAKIKVYEQK